MMFALPTLVPDLTPVLPEFNAADIQVSGLRDDSREVSQGDLFIAVSGEKYSAQQMLLDIQGSGAAAALVDSAEEIDRARLNNVPLFLVENLREERGFIASRFFGEPSKAPYVVGVTGTNGKTSCTQYIAAALEERCGVVGTMGWGFPPSLNDPGLTTPDAIKLQALFAKLVAEDATAVCIEASSHGLDQGRLAGVEIDVAVFTNLTRDHLDYHGSFDAYKRAKQRLFVDFPIKVAVLNLDDAFTREIAEVVSPKTRLLTYSLRDRDADVYCSEIHFSSKGVAATVQSPFGQISLRSELIGDFTLSNLLAVVAVLGARGYQPEVIVERIQSLSNVKGRMDTIELVNRSVAVIDYAHTPDALENALRALRAHCTGELWCVFGCGGDRDSGKRSQMGEIAGRLADRVVVTDDNPRTENSVAIIDQVLEGIVGNNRVEAISDRKQAIRHALEHCSHNDIVLIAGKGHEDYQEVNGERHHFSDHEEVEYRALEHSRQIIVGLGMTGQSLLRYCAQEGLSFEVVEDQPNDQVLVDLRSQLGEFAVSQNLEVLGNDRVLLSPGVPVSHPVVKAARANKVEVSNDIQLLADLRDKPLCLITGSNGKSTVTSFVGQLLTGTNMPVALGGNIGIPALSLLEQGKDAKAYALEVSSYQLEVATDCHAEVAVLLNLSPDHLDRYESVEDYYRAKTNVFNGAEVAIYGRDIEFPLHIPAGTEIVTFGLDEPVEGHFGLREIGGQLCLAKGFTSLSPVSELPSQGSQDLLNILAAIAISEALGGDQTQILNNLASLERLPHRFEEFGIEAHRVINDSKSTNPASTLAALGNLESESRPIYLLLGGLTKDADFSVLQGAVANQVAQCLIYGRDREQIHAQVGQGELFETLGDCLDNLQGSIEDSSVILFSPGCASQDQYKNYIERGEWFKQEVRRLFL